MRAEAHAQIIDILDRCRDMTIATIRPDGFPQATVVSFVHDDAVIYFMTTADTQKARNIAASDKVSLTVTPTYENWASIEGLSIGGHASTVTDAEEFARVATLMMERFPEAADFADLDLGPPLLIRIDPVVITILDYARAFGHSETIAVQERITAPA